MTSKSPTTQKINHLFWYALAALAVLCVSIIILHDYRSSATNRAKVDTNWSLIARPITKRDHTVGKVGAPIQVIVYSDFQCKYCGHFFDTTLLQLQVKYGDKIVVAYRHLPLPAQPQSQVDAEASECVYQLGGNDAFWRFAHEMYGIPNFYNGIDVSRLPGLAAQAGVDETAYRACMEAGEGKARVQEDKLEGSVAGLSVTPSTILKSAHRAMTVEASFYPQIAVGLDYLLQSEAQISAGR